jgi:hypothetical protein
MKLLGSLLRPGWSRICKNLPRALAAVALTTLMTGGTVLANGPMGGGSGEAHHQGSGESHHGGEGQPMIPPDISFPGSGDAGTEAGPEGPGGVPYPPSGPDRTDTLINQINQLGTKHPPKDDKTYARCEDLRSRINVLENEGSQATKDSGLAALNAQRRFDRYSGMSLREMDAELALKKAFVGALVTNDDDDDDSAVMQAADDIRALLELAKLRERYGNGYVYQNALKDTELYRHIQDSKEYAALHRRDTDEPQLRDLKAEYAELDC